MIVLSATKSLPVLGLPTGFYQNIHKYYREAKVVAYLATQKCLVETPKTLPKSGYSPAVNIASLT